MYKKFIAIRTISESNTRDHWTIARVRHKQQKNIVLWTLKADKPQISLPCEIIMTRHGSKEMDDDNLSSALKYIRDAIAEYIHPGLPHGKADGDKRLKFKYDQVISSPKGLTIEIKSLNNIVDNTNVNG